MTRANDLWKRFRGTIRGVDSSNQLAWGVVLGMMIGLLPKDSLLPYAMGILLLLSRANLLTALLAVLLFSWISPLVDPLSHLIGIRLLTIDVIESSLATVMASPGVAWTRLDNSVVVGHWVIGLVLTYPVYRSSFRFFEVFGSRIAKVLRNTRIARWFIGEPQTPGLEG